MVNLQENVWGAGKGRRNDSQKAVALARRPRALGDPGCGGYNAGRL